MMSSYVPHIFYECLICVILDMVEIVGGWFQGVIPKEQLFQPFNLENFGVSYIFVLFPRHMLLSFLKEMCVFPHNHVFSMDFGIDWVGNLY